MSDRFESIGRAAGFLARQIEESLGVLLARANDVRDYLRCLASVVGQDRAHLGWWIAPSGFHVMADYRQLDQIEVRVPLGRRPKFVYRTPADEADPDTRKQSAAIVPNLIHSLDAAHLALTVDAAARDRPGMAFASVHDSFATHAADAAFLARKLREAFVWIYEPDPDEEAPFGRWLPEIHEQVAFPWAFNGNWEALPAPPEPGAFDISAVLDSPYFFA